MNAIYPYLIIVLIILIGVGYGLSHFLKKKPQPEAPPEPTIHLVSAEAAARRALCLHTIMERGKLEYIISMARHDQPGQVAKVIEQFKPVSDRITDYLKAWGLWESLSRKEKALLEKEFGDWSQKEITDASWRADSLLVIEWALGLQEEIAPYDQQAGEKVEEILPTKQPKEFIARARLKPDTEIAEARDIAELWLWRARTTQIQKSPDQYPPPRGSTYEMIIQKTVEKAEADGLFKSIGQDFPAFGKSYKSLTEEELSQAMSIASERLYALNWLCGYAQDWDTVPTDT